MKISRAVAIQNQFVVRLRDVYSTVRMCRMMHADAIKICRERVFDALPKSTPRHVQEFLRGYDCALYDAIWSEVEFCYRDAEGVIYSTHKDSTHRLTQEFYASGRGCELCTLERAHLWKGTDKPYTGWTMPRDK